MIFNQLLLIITEGLIFGLFAYGIYLSFQWLRFPDLTPDGSFVVGGCIFVKMAGSGLHPLLALLLSFLAGSLSGVMTGSLNRFIRIPPVIAGLMMSIALYSVGWVVLGKPNQFLENSQTLVGNVLGPKYNFLLLLYVIAIVGVATAFLFLFSDTIWGLRIKAIGENPLIVGSFTKNESAYYLWLLALSNGIVAMAGALFVQRSFSADVNMGVGQTIVGLIGMIIGLLLSSTSRKTYVVLLLILLGSILYKGVMFAILEFGLPAEFFRLASAAVLVLLFSVMRTSRINVLKGLRWN
jgi:putative tryptophan/tyrosine transport system permease protein